MKRLLRILRNSWAVLSLLLFTLIVILIVRSYFITDWFMVYKFEYQQYRTYFTAYHVQIGKGGIGYNQLLQSQTDPEKKFEAWIRQRVSQRQSSMHGTKPAQYPYFNFGPSKKHFGVDVGHFRYADATPIIKRPRAEGFEVIFPLWHPLLLLILTGGPFWLLVYRARRRPKPGHCAHCGYDLRASPNLCPECGAIAIPTPPKSSLRQ